MSSIQRLSSQLLQTNVIYNEIICPRRDLNPGQRILTVMVTDVTRCDTRSHPSGARQKHNPSLGGQGKQHDSNINSVTALQKEIIPLSLSHSLFGVMMRAP